jgi:hypothetical protein
VNGHRAASVAIVVLMVLAGVLVVAAAVLS